MTDDFPSGDAGGPVIIGFTMTQLDSGGWVASAVVLSDPAGAGPSRHVTAAGASSDEARRALIRQVAALGGEPLPGIRAHRAG